MVKYCDPVFGFPQLVRFSWSTAENALQETAYHVEWETVEEDGTSKTPKNTSITSFFRMTKNQNEEKKEHEFFTNRFLSRKVEL